MAQSLRAHEIQLADETNMTNYSMYSPFHRQQAFLHSRLAYTHSDCSSSLSSMSVASNRWRQQRFVRMYSDYRRWINMYNLMRWISVLIIIGLSAGLCIIHGVFQQEYEIEFAYNDDILDILQYPFSVALIGATQLACFVGFIPLSLLISRKINNHMTILLGMMITTGGLLAAGFGNHIWQLCLSQGVLVGIGAALSTSAAVECLNPRKFVQIAGPILTAAGVGGGVLVLVTSRLIIQQQTTSLVLRWLALIVGGGQLIAVTVLLLAEYKNQQPEGSDNHANGGRKVSEPDPWITTTFTTTTTITSSYQPSRELAIRHWIRKPHHVLGLVSSICHCLSIPGPLLFISSYATHQLSSTYSMSSAALLATLCFSLAIGSTIFTRALQKQYLSNTKMLGLVYAGCSLTIWCFWLPAANSWAMAVIFCIAYGLVAGMVNSIILADNSNAPNMLVTMLIPAAGLFIGTCVDGWLLISFSRDGSALFSPLITFTASASLTAAIASAGSAFATPSYLANNAPRSFKNFTKI